MAAKQNRTKLKTKLTKGLPPERAPATAAVAVDRRRLDAGRRARGLGDWPRLAIVVVADVLIVGATKVGVVAADGVVGGRRQRDAYFVDVLFVLFGEGDFVVSILRTAF